MYRVKWTQIKIVNKVEKLGEIYNKKNDSIPIGSEESTIIASYFPLGACCKNLIAAKIIKFIKVKIRP